MHFTCLYRLHTLSYCYNFFKFNENNKCPIQIDVVESIIKQKKLKLSDTQSWP